MNAYETQHILALVATLELERQRLVAENERLVAENDRIKQNAVDIIVEDTDTIERAKKDVKMMCDAVERRDVVIKKLRERGDFHKAESARHQQTIQDFDELYQETAENLMVEVQFRTGGYNDDGEYVWDMNKRVE